MSSRPSWDETFANICVTVSRRSTCAKIQVAAIIVKDENIISIGYNGVPSKQQHCQEYWKEQGICLDSSEFKMKHREWSAVNELHAEINAIVKCNTSLSGAKLYTTYSPCVDCAKCIIASGIKKVVYVKQNMRAFDQVATLFSRNSIIFVNVNFI